MARWAASPPVRRGVLSPEDLILPLDHLVYAVPRFDRDLSDLEEQLGVRAAPGGRHPQWGTRNALMALGPTAYLEIIGPDPLAARPTRPRPFGIDQLQDRRLASWVVRATDLERVAARAGRAGLDLGAVSAGERTRPDGVTLHWRSTDPMADRAGGVVPFLIAWGESPHPAGDLPPALGLLALRAEHPRPVLPGRVLDVLGVTLMLTYGPHPALIARLETPKGEFELR
jgi:glyoxalase-like protein